MYHSTRVLTKRPFDIVFFFFSFFVCAEPLTKLQCSPTSDGAGAAIVCSEAFVRKHGLEGQAIEIVGQSMTTDAGSR